MASLFALSPLDDKFFETINYAYKSSGIEVPAATSESIRCQSPEWEREEFVFGVLTCFVSRLTSHKIAFFAFIFSLIFCFSPARRAVQQRGKRNIEIVSDFLLWLCRLWLSPRKKCYKTFAVFHVSNSFFVRLISPLKSHYDSRFRDIKVDENDFLFPSRLISIFLLGSPTTSPAFNETIKKEGKPENEGISDNPRLRLHLSSQ